MLWALWGWFLMGLAGGAVQAGSTAVPGATLSRAGMPEVREVLEKLAELPPPLPWEAKGVLVVTAPGEYYRMEFRLLAKGPEALRLELFDPFGRPAYYLTVFQGRVRAVSPGEKKPLPLNPALLAAALTGETGFSLEAVLGLLWGRIPLKTDRWEEATVLPDTPPSSRKLFIPGDLSQTIRIQNDPFRISGGEFKKKGTAGAVQVAFAEFVELSGSFWPREIKVRDEGTEKQFHLTYGQIIPRSDFPEEAFQLADPGGR
ncbi:MAG: hypothetical protein MUF69_00930 [Desulfobacterota bacterium]|nr:hypothetical protein [Thermodesulfobacteriota bacterium]